MDLLQVNKKNPMKILTPRRRELMLKVMDGVLDDKIQHILFYIERMPRHKERILLWLIENRIVGKELVKFYVDEFDKNVLNLITEVARRIEKSDRKVLKSDQHGNIY